MRVAGRYSEPLFVAANASKEGPEIGALLSLEDENRRLNQIVADQGLDIAMLKDVAG